MGETQGNGAPVKSAGQSPTQGTEWVMNDGERLGTGRGHGYLRVLSLMRAMMRNLRLFGNKDLQSLLVFVKVGFQKHIKKHQGFPDYHWIAECHLKYELNIICGNIFKSNSLTIIPISAFTPGTA